MVSPGCSGDVEGEKLKDSGWGPTASHSSTALLLLFYILDFQIRFLLSKDHAN